MLLLLATGVLGCSADAPRFAVSGEVTFEGKPIEQGSIGFVPLDPTTGCPAGGNILGGKFSIPSQEGPRAGEYRVLVYAERPTGRVFPADEGGSTETIREVVQYLPAIYNDQTTLTASIEEDRTDLHFELKRPNGRNRP